MFGWKRRALAAEARLTRAEYHFTVMHTYADGTTSETAPMCVVDGTLTVYVQPQERQPGTWPVVKAEVFVRKVVDGVLVSESSDWVPVAEWDAQ